MNTEKRKFKNSNSRTSRLTFVSNGWQKSLASKFTGGDDRDMDGFTLNLRPVGGARDPSPSRWADYGGFSAESRCREPARVGSDHRGVRRPQPLSNGGVRGRPARRAAHEPSAAAAGRRPGRRRSRRHLEAAGASDRHRLRQVRAVLEAQRAPSRTRTCTGCRIGRGRGIRRPPGPYGQHLPAPASRVPDRGGEAAPGRRIRGAVEGQRADHVSRRNTPPWARRS